MSFVEGARGHPRSGLGQRWWLSGGAEAPPYVRGKCSGSWHSYRNHNGNYGGFSCAQNDDLPLRTTCLLVVLSER